MSLCFRSLVVAWVRRRRRASGAYVRQCSTTQRQGNARCPRRTGAYDGTLQLLIITANGGPYMKNHLQRDIASRAEGRDLSSPISIGREARQGSAAKLKVGRSNPDPSLAMFGATSATMAYSDIPMGDFVWHG